MNPFQSTIQTSNPTVLPAVHVFGNGTDQQPNQPSLTGPLPMSFNPQADLINNKAMQTGLMNQPLLPYSNNSLQPPIPMNTSPPINPIYTGQPNPPPPTIPYPTDPNICIMPPQSRIDCFNPFSVSVDDKQIINIICPQSTPPPSITFPCPPLFTVVKNVLTRSTQFTRVQSTIQSANQTITTTQVESSESLTNEITSIGPQGISAGLQSATEKTTSTTLQTFEWPSCLAPCLLKQIAVKIMSCNAECGPTAVHATTESIFSTLSQYSWEAKAVLALSSFAIEFGHFSYLLYQIRQSTTAATADVEFFRSLASLRSMLGFTIASFDDQLTQIHNILGTTVQVMGSYFQLTTGYGSIQPLPIRVELICYWVTLTVVACATQLNMLTCCRRDNLVELNRYFTNIQVIQQRLEVAISYPRLLNTITNPTDIVTLLRAMFFSQNITVSPLLTCADKTPVNFDDLCNHKVLLLISDLDISDNDIGRIKLIYNIIVQETLACKIVWVPIVNQCTPQTLAKFESVQSKMQWLTVDMNIVTQMVGIRYIKEQKWYIQGTTTLVLLNNQGQVEIPNAFPFCCGPPELFPWGPIDITKVQGTLQQVWVKIVVSSMGVNQVMPWMDDGNQPYSFFYGGTNETLIQTFGTQLATLKSHLFNSAGISIESYCVTQQIERTNFWRGVESMYTWAETGKLVNLSRDIQTLLSYKTSQEGWVLLCQGPRAVIVTHLPRMSYVVANKILQTGIQIEKVTFEQNIITWLNQATKDLGRIPCRLELPCTSIGNPIQHKTCHDCCCGMRIRIVYECAHETPIVQHNHQMLSSTTSTQFGYNQHISSTTTPTLPYIQMPMNNNGSIVTDIPGMNTANSVVTSNQIVNALATETKVIAA